MKSFDFEIEESVQEEIRAFTHSSSWIGNVNYNPESQIMKVKMRGKTYDFPGVTEREFRLALGLVSNRRSLPARLAGLVHGIPLPRSSWEQVFLIVKKSLN